MLLLNKENNNNTNFVIVCSLYLFVNILWYIKPVFNNLYIHSFIIDTTMAIFETTASSLYSASGSVLSSEALSAYDKHAQHLKNDRGTKLASPSRIQRRSRGF